MSPIRVLVAEDHPQVREGLVALLSRAGMEVVGEAFDGSQAVQLYRVHKPDVTLLDLRMPRLDGLQAMLQILAETPRARIIVLTSLEDQEQVCLDAGARAILLKDAPTEHILNTIRLVHQT